VFHKFIQPLNGRSRLDLKTKLSIKVCSVSLWATATARFLCLRPAPKSGVMHVMWESDV